MGKEIDALKSVRLVGGIGQFRGKRLTRLNQFGCWNGTASCEKECARDLPGIVVCS